MPGILIEPGDVCIYVTEACNSNCMMCPMSAGSRRRGRTISPEEWEHLEEIIPADTQHITITGGEPFLEYRYLLPALEKINQTYPYAEILILTNGRALSIPELFLQTCSQLTEQYCIAIPIHAPERKLHDQITQSPGSFEQTMRAIRALSASKAKIEVRIVGHKLNLHHINATFKMLADSGSRIDVINLLAMEMTGCAAVNREKLWCDYREICRAGEEGIQYAILKGINVGLYNFPLCTVPKNLWPIVKNSITPSKIRYDEKCKTCAENFSCDGLFYSTYGLGLCKVQPITKDG